MQSPMHSVAAANAYDRIICMSTGSGQRWGVSSSQFSAWKNGVQSWSDETASCSESAGTR